VARAARALLVVVLLLAAAAGAAGWWSWRQLQQPFAGYAGEARVTVEPGASVTAILARLEGAGVIRDARLARLWLLAEGSPSLQAGVYLFREPASTPEALGKLVRGDVEALRVTLVEGLTLEETADHLANEGFGDRDAFLAAMRDPAAIADFDPAAADLEGYLFPDSYTFAADADERAIVAAMVANFRRRWREAVAPKLSGGEGRDRREIVSLASIVEKEARLPAERPLIAAVYANRLERGMGLFADPTVIYAMKKAGRWEGNIRRADLQMDSPYNTYRYAGLPPGPICSPGAGALAAAAAPADVPHLYFVSRNDGSHVFATTLAEHNRNVDTWQRRYWRDRRKAEAEAQRRTGEDAEQQP
jgi:UPF0755 protein